MIEIVEIYTVSYGSALTFSLARSNDLDIDFTFDSGTLCKSDFSPSIRIEDAETKYSRPWHVRLPGQKGQLLILIIFCIILLILT
jgi:hypothetical protein